MWRNNYDDDYGYPAGGFNGAQDPNFGMGMPHHGGDGSMPQRAPRQQNSSRFRNQDQAYDPGMGGGGQLHYAPEYSLNQLAESRWAPNPNQGNQGGAGGQQQGRKGGKGQGGRGQGNNRKGGGKGGKGGYDGGDQTMQMYGGDMPPMQMQGDKSILQHHMSMAGANAEPPPGWGNTTTIMMRNLPNKYTQRMLLTEITQVGFLGHFDFLYLPIDPETSANRGYAFLNFIDPSFAWMFKHYYEGRKMNQFNSNKVVTVMAATLQGFDANYTHYSLARVNRGDPAARPLFLREPTQPAAALKANTRSTIKKQGPPGGAGAGGGGGGAGGGNGGRRKGSGDNEGGDDFQQGAGAPPYTAVPDGPAAPFPGQQAGGSADFAPQAGVARFCPQCGGPIQPHFQFCAQCGFNINTNP